MAFKSIAAALAIFLACCLPNAASASYTIQYIDTAGVSAQAWGINNSNFVAGVTYQPWNVSGMVASEAGLATVKYGGANTYAFGINNSGAVAGTWEYGGVSHGFVQTNGVWTTFDVNLPGSIDGYTFAHGINDLGNTVGFYSTTWYQSFIRHADGNLETFLPTGAFGSQAYGINNAGDVVGSTSTGFGFLRKNDGTFETIAPSGSLYSIAMGINNLGDIAGYSLQPDFYAPGSGAQVGFIRHRDGRYELLDMFSGMNDYLAGINDAGTIAGVSGGRPFFATLNVPATVPEPGTYMLIGLGLVGLFILKRHRI